MRDSLRPWTVQLEEEIQIKLFSSTEQRTFFVEHQFKELLRADDLTRHQVYQLGIANGIYTPNECRAWENLDPLDDEPDDEADEAAEQETQEDQDEGNTDLQPTDSIQQ